MRMQRKNNLSIQQLGLLLVLLLLACRLQSASQVSVIQSSLATATPEMATPTATASPTSSPTPTATSTPTASPTPLPTDTPTATPTPDPYAGLTVADLASRTYGGGEVQIEESLGANESFSRYLISYPSEGLKLYGFMNIPQGQGPFPVAVVMHGYISPEQYNTLAYTTRYADALARAGYLVFHPNYRNWPPSDEGPEKFRASHAVDTLNLITIIREQAGRPGPLELADPTFVGMMGHSMGGGITLRVVTISGAVQAAVLYGAMSGDEKLNYEAIMGWSGGTRGFEELDTPEADLQRISPIYHLERIITPLSIHHGDYDGTVPLQWSLDLCQRLQNLAKPVECFTYPGQPHTFQGEGDQQFIQRMIDFFNRTRANNSQN
jgi:dienelactone hydrolase